MEYFDTIHNSPSKIYHHALPLSPSKSWLHEYYSSELLQEVKVVGGLQAEWGLCSRTVAFSATAAALGFPTIPTTLACWGDLVAVGGYPHSLIIFDGITGMCTSVLSGHTDDVCSLAFSLDGVFLVSGSDDRTIILWDIQTGGVIRRFCGHTHEICSVSISPDCATIVSGSYDMTIRLWDTWTGECHYVIDPQNNPDVSHVRHKIVDFVSFSPTNSQLFLSVSGGYIQQWDLNGHNIGPSYKGHGVTFSTDGTCFVSWRKKIATVQNSNSGVIVTKLQVSGDNFKHCCFSPNDKYVAGGAGYTIYVWDITSIDPHLINTFMGHTQEITSLGFSSSLVSLAGDKSIKFWQIGVSSANSESTPPASASIKSISLQANDGIAISSDSAGVVRTWDITTGLCKESFHTTAQDIDLGDVRLINSMLIFAWFAHGQVQIWDIGKGEFIQKLDRPTFLDVIKISEDGSTVFLLGNSIQAWSIWTGEAMGEVELETEPLLPSLVVDGLRVWVYSRGLLVQGWDFGISSLTPTPLSNALPDTHHLSFIDGHIWRGPIPSFIKDMVTGDEVFQLPGRYAEFTSVQWDGRYLVAGYSSGKLLILDFNQRIPH